MFNCAWADARSWLILADSCAGERTLGLLVEVLVGAAGGGVALVGAGEAVGVGKAVDVGVAVGVGEGVVVDVGVVGVAVEVAVDVSAGVAVGVVFAVPLLSDWLPGGRFASS